MKKMIRTPHHPLAQVIRRISEMDRFAENGPLEGKRELLKEHSHGPVPSSMMDSQVVQFEELVISGTKIKVSGTADRCVKIGDRIALIENVLQSLGRIYIVFRE